MHKGQFYKQIDGCITGGTLGPTLANFLMARLEQKFFSDKSNDPPLPQLYLRYVDDIYTVFNDNQNCYNFLTILNSKHQNLKLTVEKATESLSFLDVEIKSDEIGFKRKYDINLRTQDSY